MTFCFPKPTTKKVSNHMKLSKKAGEWTGKVVKATAATPNKTSSWAKQFGHDVKDGYRSVIPAKSDDPTSVDA